ncbi:Heme oxygenase [Paenibacillus algorifonticola]|uniref:Heme oxygenase n=1 Tax=Paenibacillus algorifonticola TaxID=684063 RepID=A0A1I1YRJ8_9BACL|nr:biliverdin-producing heme oxygenase [Paenibacillus algorifonticola]SFE22214.1 Heme oxygenase [Paenibacillus algorifonticola]
MNVMARLKEETADNHKQIEDNRFAKAILNQTLNITDYSLYLQKFYGFIKPVERHIAAWAEAQNLQELRIFLQSRAKSPLLERDLIALGLSEEQVQQLPECKQLPELAAAASVLGYMYVIEGSTMGGQIITRQVRKFLPFTDHASEGTAYFNAYGTETRAKWAEFSQFVSESALTEEEANQVVETAKQTFLTLEVWFNV